MPQIDTFIETKKIQACVRDLGNTISKDYQGKELVVIGVLKGAFIFMADLVRHLTVPVSCDFLSLSSYGDLTESSGIVKITQDLTQPIEGKNVLIVEDIIDTGLTMDYLLKNLHTRKPQSINICALLSKPSRRKVHVDIHYVGFEIDDTFVVGYGMDYASLYRNLDFIGVCKT